MRERVVVPGGLSMRCLQGPVFSASHKRRPPFRGCPAEVQWDVNRLRGWRTYDIHGTFASCRALPGAVIDA